MENTDAHWKDWGRLDPYRAVLFNEKYKRARLSENVQEFFESGEVYVDSLMQKIERFNPSLPLDTAVEFGCGVGRLAIPLARRFTKVIGVDISPEMLNESRKNCALFGVSNVEFALSDDLLSLVPSGVQLVHSCKVLQHIAVKRGLAISRQLVDRLAPGGVFAVHVTIDRDLHLLKKLAYIVKHSFPPSRYLLNILQGKALSEPLMQMNPYPIQAMHEVLVSAGVKDVWIYPLLKLHSVLWFGTKA
jgi:2-polyprenyl-3-methyl-5-hydroxy-6-metoxy-1,4-benzoquinol methylase